MTALSTDKLEALLAAITPGPWELVSLSGYGSPFSVRMAYQSDNPKAPTTHYGVQSVRRRDDARAISLVPALIREVLARRKAEAWQPIGTAPFHTPVIVKVGQMTFPAVLRGNAAMDENGQDCAQWQAVSEGEHPPCWSDGACWASNADGLTSMQPTGWKPTTPEAEGGCDAE